MVDSNITSNAVSKVFNESDVNLANQLLSNVPFIGNNQALQALFLLLVFIIITKLFLFISKKYIRKLTVKTKFEWDEKLLNLLERPIAIVLILIGIKISLVPLHFIDRYKEVLTHFINSIIIIAVFYSLAIAINLLIDVWGINFAKKTKIKISEDLLPLAHKSVDVVFVLIAALLILKEWGINIGPLLASLGIAGIAIGLALQPTLSNIFAGIALILDKNFKKGDIVEIDSISGTVYEIGLRTTRIKTFDHDIVTFPNNNLANMKILNHLQPDIRARFNIQVSVVHGTDILKLKKIITNEIEKNKRILKDPKLDILFSEIGDFALKFDIYCWVDDFNTRGSVKDELLTAIYNSLRKNKINIPHPAATVYLKQ